MDPVTSRKLLFPPCGLENAAALIANPVTIPGLTEAFPANLPFCLNLSSGSGSVSKIYGSDQDLFNSQSASIVLGMAELLLDSGATLSRMQALWQTYWTDFIKLQQPPLTAENAFTPTLYLNNSPADYFFSCLGLLRRTIAWAANAETDWAHYGLNRYPAARPITTPTWGNRYQPSIGRCDIARMKDIYRSYELGLEGDDISTTYRNYLATITFFDILKASHGKTVAFGRLKDIGQETESLENICVPDADYAAIFGRIDELFTALLGKELLPVRQFLGHVFRIQFWFIHIMPFQRGSLAVMNLFRYVMTAYYNHRARSHQLPPLPLVPSRGDYFPDLEALLNCQTEDEFVLGSMQTYYCVNFNACC